MSQCRVTVLQVHNHTVVAALNRLVRKMFPHQKKSRIPIKRDIDFLCNFEGRLESCIPSGKSRSLNSQSQSQPHSRV